MCVIENFSISTITFGIFIGMKYNKCDDMNEIYKKRFP